MFLTPEDAAASATHSSGAATRIVTLSDQLRSARTIQRSLLPQTFPLLGDWQVSGSCRSAGPLGGDFYDVIRAPSGHTMLLVADVMGKGIPAALIASVARTVFRMAVNSVDSPEETFSRVNELLYEDLSSADMFLTAQGVWLDTVNNSLRVVGAGHCPMLIRHSTGETSSFCTAGIPIGVAPRFTYNASSFSLESVECVLMYTDGVIDARNESGELFGMTRLQSWLASAQVASLNPVELQEALERELAAFCNDSAQVDDQTTLILRRAQS